MRVYGGSACWRDYRDLGPLPPSPYCGLTDEEGSIGPPVREVSEDRVFVRSKPMAVKGVTIQLGIEFTVSSLLSPRGHIMIAWRFAPTSRPDTCVVRPVYPVSKSTFASISDFVGANDVGIDLVDRLSLFEMPVPTAWAFGTIGIKRSDARTRGQTDLLALPLESACPLAAVEPDGTWHLQLAGPSIVPCTEVASVLADSGCRANEASCSGRIFDLAFLDLPSFEAGQVLTEIRYDRRETAAIQSMCETLN